MSEDTEREAAPAWKRQLAKELLKPKRKRFPRRRIFSSDVDSIWTMDLLDIHQFSRQNKNLYLYSLCWIYFLGLLGLDH